VRTHIELPARDRLDWAAPVGVVLTLGATYVGVTSGSEAALLPLVGLLAFALAVLLFLAVPHLAVAVTIPFLVTLPALRVFVADGLGPAKDVVTIAAFGAALLLVLQRRLTGHPTGLDRPLALLVASLLALYLVNLGGGFSGGGFDAGWLHGVRLTAEPLMLLLVGLLLEDPRRTLRWATASLLATCAVVAAYGLLQQWIGIGGLLDLGYEWDREVRDFDGRLRSFGTLDDPFKYAAILLFGLAAVLLWLRRSALAVALGFLLGLGLLFSWVRTAAVVAVVLLALALVSRRRAAPAVFLLVAAVGAAGVVGVLSAEATESRTVRAGPSVYLTLNGRTDVWQLRLPSATSWVIGRGVGEVGTAADRARVEVSDNADDALAAEGRQAVDSGYFATVADVGALGLVVRIGLFAVLLTAAYRAARRSDRAGWLALGILAVLVLDALTRDTFTGYPVAYVGMLVAGLSLAAAREE
jgi:hypothetical protein